jgi:hypothetical protein
MDSYNGDSVMIWTAISNGSKTELVYVPGNLTAVRYRDEILQTHLMYVFDRQSELFQQDNSRPHAARLTMDYLEQNNINVLPWPSKSADLNPIEYLRDHLDKRVRQSVNLHLRPSINYAKCCNRNGEQYHEII